ncbi:MAG TPA: hypothetical protein VMM36_16605 [Opitutaceae bacterium]|nr:hypothetical protein [Opitutaceae bacterium]
MNDSTHDTLKPVLGAWRVSPARSRDFSTGVWRRIEARRNRDSWAAFARGHPAMFAALIVIATASGGWVGAESARSRVAEHSAAMADSYVQSMDARQMEMP